MATIRLKSTEVCLELRAGLWDYKQYDIGMEKHEGRHFTGCRWQERTIYAGPFVLAITTLLQ